MRTGALLSSTFLVFMLACGGGGGGSDAGGDSGSDAGDSGLAICRDDADCDDGLFCNGRETCDATSSAADERGCVAAASGACLASQTCNEADDFCVNDCAVERDADGDGHNAIDCGGDDCDDADGMRFPGNTEVCDAMAHDEDCDASTFGSKDTDGDSYIDAACCNVDAAGAMVCGDDCDDGAMSVHPTAAEACNGIDDNCDGMLSDTEDMDGDGVASIACSGTDCNDGDDRVYPGAPELCDGRDNDCSLPGDMAGSVDLAEDVDGDGFAAIDATCMGGPLPKTDCDDTADRGDVYPGARELCDGRDNDCDGMTDEEPDATANSCVDVGGASVSCAGGVCAVSACSGTLADCNSDAADGCEVDTATALSDCGTCGTSCLLGCTASACDEAVGISAGLSHTCVVRSSGEVLCWGSNVYGQLGDGTTAERHRPVRVSGLTDAVEVSAGGSHTCARRRSGAVVCWGRNSQGGLGDGTTTQRLTPVSVSGLSDAVEVSAGDNYTCARRASGQVVCWGFNRWGQLGNGTTASSHVPVNVSGLSDALAIAAGGDHCCARRSGDALVCWGHNHRGQLGDESATDRSSPVSVHIGARGVGVSGGELHVCAVSALSTHGVNCWGANTSSQLGDNTTTDRNKEWPATSTRDVASVSAGSGHTCALQTDGRVICWGKNTWGQVGDGTTTTRAARVWVQGFSAIPSDAVALDVGGGHSCLITSGGQVLCWGLNRYGQLGDGTVMNRLTPTAIAPVTP